MYNLDMLNFSKLLKKYRKSKGITLEKLGNNINKTKATVSKYENGEIIPDILTLLEICNELNINLSQLFPSQYNNTNSHSYNPFHVNKLYLYYYTENVLITSVLELIEENNKILAKLYNGIKNINLYAKEYSYYYEGIFECDKTIGYINLNSSNLPNSLFEKVQISFTIPWTQKINFTNFFILGITPNSLPILKKGIISLEPIKDISIFKNDLTLSKEELSKMQKNNAWILDNKNFDYYFYLT